MRTFEIAIRAVLGLGVLLLQLACNRTNSSGTGESVIQRSEMRLEVLRSDAASREALRRAGAQVRPFHGTNDIALVTLREQELTPEIDRLLAQHRVPEHEITTALATRATQQPISESAEIRTEILARVEPAKLQTLRSIYGFSVIPFYSSNEVIELTIKTSRVTPELEAFFAEHRASQGELAEVRRAGFAQVDAEFARIESDPEINRARKQHDEEVKAIEKKYASSPSLLDDMVWESAQRYHEESRRVQEAWKNRTGPNSKSVK
jgi:hypothetical protein